MSRDELLEYLERRRLDTVKSAEQWRAEYLKTHNPFAAENYQQRQGALVDLGIIRDWVERHWQDRSA